MRTILRDLESVGGVRCGYVVRNGEILASTFPADKAAALAASQEIARGVAEGLALIDREWEEVLVDLGDLALMVLPVEEGFTLALLAGTDTNPTLLRVVMQSSVRQIRTMLSLPPPVPTPIEQPVAAPPPEPPKAAARPAPAPEQRPQPAAKPAAPAPPPRPAQEQKPAVAAKPVPPPQKAAPVPPRPAVEQKPAAAPQKAATPPKPAAAAPVPPKPAEAKPAAPAAKGKDAEDAEPLLPKILELLTGSIGPVARVTFKRGVSRWKESNPPTVGNLPSLVEILAADLSSDEEKRWFSNEVDRLRGH